MGEDDTVGEDGVVVRVRVRERVCVGTHARACLKRACPNRCTGAKFCEITQRFSAWWFGELVFDQC